MIKLVKLVNIPVKDQDKALAFYTEKLGFTVETDVVFGPQRWIELAIPGASTRVSLFTPESLEDRIGTFTGISFGTDDIETTYQEMVDCGVVFINPLKQESWGASAVFQDVDGNSFVLATEA